MGEIPTSGEITLTDTPSGVPIRLKSGSGDFTEADMDRVKELFARELAGHTPAERRRAVDRLQKQLAAEERKVARGKEALAVLDTLKEWFDAQTDWVLERNDCSRLHHFQEACRSSRLLGADIDDLNNDAEFGAMLQHTFVVKQDWAGAFEHAEGIDDSIKLPYTLCAFEFRYNGRNVLAAAFDDEGNIKFTAFIQADDYWVHIAAQRDRLETQHDKIALAIWQQIRAICIALDAEVATHSVVRAPHKLNKKRAADGKIPLADFHVVELARRHRVANPTAAAGQGSKKRMHFRRGHWRHYETSKTWVKWCLVGDPDLGFIQKQYSL